MQNFSYGEQVKQKLQSLREEYEETEEKLESMSDSPPRPGDGDKHEDSGDSKIEGYLHENVSGTSSSASETRTVFFRMESMVWEPSYCTVFLLAETETSESVSYLDAIGTSVLNNQIQDHAYDYNTDANYAGVFFDYSLHQPTNTVEMLGDHWIYDEHESYPGGWAHVWALTDDFEFIVC